MTSAPAKDTGTLGLSLVILLIRANVSKQRMWVEGGDSATRLLKNKVAQFFQKIPP